MLSNGGAVVASNEVSKNPYGIKKGTVKK